MDKLIPIKIPLLNPNEPEALLASLDVAEGVAVKQGQVLAVIETTKSTGEIEAEASGFLVGLQHAEGDTLQAGDVLGYIGESSNAKDPSLPPWSEQHTATAEQQPGLAGLRITGPARELALAEGLDLEDLPQDILVTRQVVMALIKPTAPAPKSAVPKDEKRLVIYGAGGHGCSLAALVRHSEDYELVGFLDDGLPAGGVIDGLPILGGGEQLDQLAQQGICLAVNGVGGVGDLPARLSVYGQLENAGYYCPTVIHRTAFLEESAVLADGVQVYPFVYIGIRVQVGYGCIINSGAIVSHDCSLAPYVNLSPGATLAGAVRVGEAALIGMRVTVNLNVSVGKRARIGNGATVKADVPDGGVVPAGTIWPPRR
jgi:sugar O-acyltransferase (sialic acid O-acetyltransferase NeuD family)